MAAVKSLARSAAAALMLTAAASAVKAEENLETVESQGVVRNDLEAVALAAKNEGKAVCIKKTDGNLILAVAAGKLDNGMTVVGIAETSDGENFGFGVGGIKGNEAHITAVFVPVMTLPEAHQKVKSGEMEKLLKEPITNVKTKKPIERSPLEKVGLLSGMGAAVACGFLAGPR